MVVYYLHQLLWFLAGSQKNSRAVTTTTELNLIFLPTIQIPRMMWRNHGSQRRNSNSNAAKMIIKKEEITEIGRGGGGSGTFSGVEKKDSSSITTDATTNIATIQAIKSEKEYFDLIWKNDENNNDDKLTVIKFHATWCKSCQKFGLHFRGMAAKEKQQESSSSNSSGNTNFGEIEYGSNIVLCKSLGVRQLPSVHFYKNGVKIDDISCGPSDFHIISERMSKYKAQIQGLDKIHDDGDLLLHSKDVVNQVLRKNNNKIHNFLKQFQYQQQQLRSDFWFHNTGM